MYKDYITKSYFYKRKTQKILLLVITIVLLLITAEIITRIYLYSDKDNLDTLTNIKNSLIDNSSKLSTIDIIKLSNNDKIIYELKPNIEGIYVEKTIKINSQGLRDYEYSINKHNDVFRIVGLGDSMMFGHGVNLEDNFLKVIERRLNENSNGINYEIINFAVPGYNTVMEIETFKEKVLKYDPDLVILSFIGNDVSLPNFIKDKVRFFRLDKSYFFEFIISKIINIELKNEFLHRLIAAPYILDEKGNIYDYENDPKKVPYKYRHMVGINSVRESFKELERNAIDKKINVVVLLDWSENNELIDESIKNNNYDDYSKKTLFHEDIKRFSEESNFYLVEPYFGFSIYVKENKISFSDLLIPNDGHPNEKLHNIIADQLFNFLIENKLLPYKVS